MALRKDVTKKRREADDENNIIIFDNLLGKLENLLLAFSEIEDEGLPHFDHSVLSAFWFREIDDVPFH